MKTTLSLTASDLSTYQAKLDAIPSSENNTFECNTWNFHTINETSIPIDFNDLENIRKDHPDWSLAHDTDWILLTKLMWLALVPPNTPSAYTSNLSALKLFWQALAHLNVSEITKTECDSVLAFLITTSWTGGRIIGLPSVKSYSNFKENARLLSYRHSLSKLGLNWISRDITEFTLKRTLKVLIPELTDDVLTYSDWTNGGTYDCLTLDMGRYYTEHCSNFFDKNYPLAIALISTFRATDEIALSVGQSRERITKFASRILEGDSCEKLKERYPSSAITTLNQVHDAVRGKFITTLKQALFEADLLKREVLQEFSIACKQQPTEETLDRLRIILWNWIRQKNIPETQKLLKGFNEPISWSTFQEQIKMIRKKHYNKKHKLPTVADYKSMGITPGIATASTESLHRQLTRLVAQSGLTVTVALTGWRRSEFGFPRSSINRTTNGDKLDQYAFPWRYQVNWYVPKSHDEVRVNREITTSIFILAERLHILHGSSDDQPCLYSMRGVRKNPFDSTDTVKRYVPALWENFVNYYPGFTQLDDHKNLLTLKGKINSGKALTKKQHLELQRLLAQKSESEWNNLSIDINLKEAWLRTRSELPRVLLGIKRSHARDNWLTEYRNGTLKKEWQKLIETHLPTEIKRWLSNLPEEELNSKFSSSVVTNHLLSGTVYPTPHAFRHMWAEAVYRRFDGDVGWMIRSQFQHISRYQWLAYIRNKDNRRTNQSVKKQVISSLVQNYVTHKGKGYAGQLHTWLRRIFKRTTVASPEEQEIVIQHLTKVEFEDIKTNPWGYCLLKRRTRRQAKCAEYGEPMRHNALPELCLVCMHNLMQSENVEWSLFHIATHVEMLRKTVIPEIFKQSSYILVKNVTKHIRTLNPAHEALPELETAMQDYETKRAA